MGKKIAATVLLVIIAKLCFSQEVWKINTVKDGIKLYTKPVPDSKIKAVKVECSFPVTVTQLVAVITDIDHNTEWVYHSKLNQMLKKVSAADIYYYSEVAVPWPAQNRDYVSHIVITQDPKTKVVVIDAPCMPGMVAEKPNIVRITHSIGKWTIVPAPNNTINVSYELEVDPAGSTPAWLINLFAVQGPLETFEKLKLQVQKPVYKNAKLGFVDD
jgi:hypothetical protein